MAHFPKPYFRKSRQLWYVQIDGREHKLGPDRDEAFRRYHQLMAEPPEQKIAADRLTELIDRFLDWVHKHRAPANYEGYRHRLQRFVDTYPKLKVAELRPYHVENWVDQYELSNTTRRNYFRAIKRCLRWAKQQGYVDRNPIEDLVAPTADHREVAFDQSEFDRLLAFVTESRSGRSAARILGYRLSSSGIAASGIPTCRSGQPPLGVSSVGIENQENRQNRLLDGSGDGNHPPSYARLSRWAAFPQ
jgi:site-specific recombinase XerC